MSRLEKATSGIKGLDLLLQNIRQGESLVWQINEIDDYKYFAQKLAKEGIRLGKNVIYFRFSDHPPLLEEQEGLKIVQMDSSVGFESFTVKVYQTLEKQETGTYYIFDCLSGLQSIWAADFMMRNFFMAICPTIKEMRAIAYFSLMKGSHSYDSIKQIANATAIYINALSGEEGMYVQPIKAANRQSKAMFFPHLIEKENEEVAKPLTDGISSSKYYGLVKISARKYEQRYLDNWDMFFLKGKDVINGTEEEKEEYMSKAYKMIIGRDPDRERLFKENYKIEDYLNVNRRMIGSGSIGGKSAGMLLARKIIERNRPDLAAHIEEHDSYYIGSNVFYTFLISNNWWKLWLEHKTEDGYFIAARALKSQLPYGEFPKLVKDKFQRMLDYYGQNPIIVRSSSYLEDGFGNAFAGKYDSVFCVNAGNPEERYKQFVEAVKEVYVSAMDESALVYRQQRGLDKADEAMSILVQRVSGSVFEDIFMPGAAGVGYSQNSYAWNKNIDPKAGMVRIVAGLGTRAVDRTQGDYPRIASLDKPDMVPISSPGDRFKFVQRYVDVLDFSDNVLLTIPIEEVAEKTPYWYNSLVMEHDRDTEQRFRDRGINKNIVATSCRNILNNEEIVKTLREMLATIHEHYKYPVDIEFTINFSEDGDFLINLVQCRPLQAKGGGDINIEVPRVPKEKTFFSLRGNIMGGPINKKFDLVAVVDSKGYADLPFKEKALTAKAIEAINKYAKENKKALMLLGPGRWGTSSEELGVPVKFAQISNVEAIFEMSFESSGLMPELSFGSHFFQDLVETNIFYGAIFEKGCTEGEESEYNKDALASCKEIYKEIPDVIGALDKIIDVYEVTDIDLTLIADGKAEKCICCKK